jgi:excisionase family DNA binding protein
MPSTWMRTKEAARHASVSPTTLYRWRCEGLPYSMVRGSILISRDDLDRYIGQHSARVILRRHGVKR